VAIGTSGFSADWFFFTAMLSRIPGYEAPLHLVPERACVVAFRGTVSHANIVANNHQRQMPLNDTECGQCTASKGLLDAWRDVYGPRVLEALSASGCAAGGGPEKTHKVILTGHSQGGAFATLAAYFLHRAGFDVQLSWAIGAGRPGNQALMDFILGRMVADQRPVALWHVTHANDGIPRWPKSHYAGGHLGRYRHQVWFRGEDPREPTFCAQPEDWGPNSTCGVFAFSRGALDFGVPNPAHCGLPFAPSQRMCFSYPWPFPAPYNVPRQCVTGGALPS